MIGPRAHETVIAAIFAYLRDAVGASFRTMDRRVAPWSKVAEQPALFLSGPLADEDQWQQQVVSRTTIECEIIIYNNSGKNPDTVPSRALADLADLVRSAFAPNGPYGTFQLGTPPLFQWARIEGRTDYYPGDWSSEGQAIAVLPLRILVP